MIEIKDIHGKIITRLRCDSLCRADLSELDLTNADLRGADFYYAKMVRTILRGPDLRGLILPLHILFGQTYRKPGQTSEQNFLQGKYHVLTTYKNNRVVYHQCQCSLFKQFTTTSAAIPY